MKSILYEQEYKKGKHFSFGKNWQNFLKSLNEERIDKAKTSLVEFLGGEEKIKGKTFVDIGCGSGIFSLAAYLLGASKIVSTDVDDFSIICVNHLKEKYGNPQNWETKKGSALDENFIKSLGQFDIIYSWGVLHHTGDMYKSFDIVTALLKSGGIFYLAIYGRSNSKIFGTPEFWLKIKRKYNSSGKFGKRIMNYMYVVYFFMGSLVFFRNPIKLIMSYKERGMNWYSDIIDWLGGYPYEFAWPDEIVNYFGNKKIYCRKLKDRRGIACNEYLLIKNDAEQEK